MNHVYTPWLASLRLKSGCRRNEKNRGSEIEQKNIRTRGAAALLDMHMLMAIDIVLPYTDSAHLMSLMRA